MNTLIYVSPEGYCFWSQSDGLYRGGCRGPWTAAEAIWYWEATRPQAAEAIRRAEVGEAPQVDASALERLALGGGTWPASVPVPRLRWLHLGGSAWPESVQVPALESLSLNGGTWPESVPVPALKTLYLNGSAWPESVQVPADAYIIR